MASGQRLGFVCPLLDLQAAEGRLGGRRAGLCAIFSESLPSVPLTSHPSTVISSCPECRPGTCLPATGPRVPGGRGSPDRRACAAPALCPSAALCAPPLPTRTTGATRGRLSSCPRSAALSAWCSAKALHTPRILDTPPPKPEVHFHLKKMYSSRHPTAGIGGWDPAVTFRSQPSSSELLDAFCVIILLVFLSFNDFPGSSLDIFSRSIAHFASSLHRDAGGHTLPKGLAVATLHLASDPNVTETRWTARLADRERGLLDRGHRRSWRLVFPTPAPAVSPEHLHRTHCSPPSTRAEIPPPPMALNEPHGGTENTAKQETFGPLCAFLCN